MNKDCCVQASFRPNKSNFLIPNWCSTTYNKIAKLPLLIVLLSVLPITSFAEYKDNHRFITIETFKDRFTMRELLAISTAYSTDSYIRAAVSKLESMNAVDLDSEIIKNDVNYLTSKSILSQNRARDILK
ncbi:MAG: hypothetical protein ACR65R_17275 [Methylomicrobium sp.]